MKKARKFIIGGITLAVTVLAGALIRTPTSIDYRGQIVEYSTVDSEISIEHEIVIEGIYYDSSLNYDSFQGTFYISDIGGIEKIAIMRTSTSILNIDIAPSSRMITENRSVLI